MSTVSLTGTSAWECGLNFLPASTSTDCHSTSCKTKLQVKLTLFRLGFSVIPMFLPKYSNSLNSDETRVACKAEKLVYFSDDHMSIGM